MRFINNGFIVLFLIFPFGRENERKREVKDERKFRYNVRWSDEIMILFYHSLYVKGNLLCSTPTLFAGQSRGDGGMSHENDSS